MMGGGLSLPVTPIPSRWSVPFWDAAKKQRLLIQSCSKCDLLIMYPKPFCPRCLSDDLGWITSDGRGTIYSFTVVERGAPSAFADLVPYVVAVVRLDEGVQMLSLIIDSDPDEVRCDQRVSVDFEWTTAKDFALPVFRLSEGRLSKEGAQ